MLEALGEEVGGGFFTTDTASTKHGDVFVVLGIEVSGDVGGEFVEGIGVRIDRTCKGTDFDFVLVASVDDKYVRIGDQGVPVLGFDVGADEIGRIDRWDAEGDNFGAESDSEPIEWRFGSDRFFVFEIGKTGIGGESGEDGIDTRASTRDRPIDPFGCQQDCAFNLMLLAQVEQGLTTICVVN